MFGWLGASECSSIVLTSLLFYVCLCVTVSERVCVCVCECVCCAVSYLPVASSTHGELVLPHGQVELLKVVAEQQLLARIRRSQHRRTSGSCTYATTAACDSVSGRALMRRAVMARGLRTVASDGRELDTYEHQNGKQQRKLESGRHDVGMSGYRCTTLAKLKDVVGQSWRRSECLKCEDMR